MNIVQRRRIFLAIGSALIIGAFLYLLCTFTDVCGTKNNFTMPKGCQSSGKYVFCPYMDSDPKGVDGKPVGNIRQVSPIFRNPFVMKYLCDRDPKCQGFNTNGWLKSKIVAPNFWNQWTINSSKGLYVKKEHVLKPVVITLPPR